MGAMKIGGIGGVVVERWDAAEARRSPWGWDGVGWDGMGCGGGPMQ